MSKNEPEKWDERDRQPLSGLRVLIVEDEAIIAMELDALMEEHGARVVGPARSLATALELARSEDISAAILDFRLGRDSVTPVAEVLRQRSIPFVFYSGQPSDDPIRAGWTEYNVIAKPATPRQLVVAVGELVPSILPMERSLSVLTV